MLVRKFSSLVPEKPSSINFMHQQTGLSFIPSFSHSPPKKKEIKKVIQKGYIHCPTCQYLALFPNYEIKISTVREASNEKEELTNQHFSSYARQIVSSFWQMLIRGIRCVFTYVNIPSPTFQRSTPPLSVSDMANDPDDDAWDVAAGGAWTT